MGFVRHFFRKLGRRISRGFAIVTDWLLISCGLLLLWNAALKINVPEARYVLLALGLLCFAVGWCSRRRRLRRTQA
jgi:hypothetical protein